MNLQELKIYAINQGIKYPSKKEEINNLVDICATNIEDGSSIEVEIASCVNDIQGVILGTK